MKILAVDDDPVILELLTHFVATSGSHRIVTAASGSEALEIIERVGLRQFDCFLFDIQMPGMDGIELIRAVRELPRCAETPILMLTAMSEKRYVDAAFAAGAIDYVTKPFEMYELKGRLALVDKLVEARKSRTSKILGVKPISFQDDMPSPQSDVMLHEPISILEVENVIEYMALENYVAQLSRSSLFGSMTFAVSIRQIEEFHARMSSFEFYSLISDVAEVISDTLHGHQFLMSYAGNGTFVCITESGWRPDMTQLMDAVNLSLSRAELYDNSGTRVQARVSTGDAIRLIWQSKATIMDSIAKVHSSAEAASVAHETARNDLWLTEKRA